MISELEWAANRKRPDMAYAGLHLAVISTGEVVLMDDQGRVIAGIQTMTVEAEKQDAVYVNLRMLVVKPPSGLTDK